MEGGGGREEGGGREGESDYCTYKPLHAMCCVCNYYTRQNKPFVAHIRTEPQT